MSALEPGSQERALKLLCRIHRTLLEAERSFGAELKRRLLANDKSVGMAQG